MHGSWMICRCLFSRGQANFGSDVESNPVEVSVPPTAGLGLEAGQSAVTLWEARGPEGCGPLGVESLG